MNMQKVFYMSIKQCNFSFLFKCARKHKHFCFCVGAVHELEMLTMNFCDESHKSWQTLPPMYIHLLGSGESHKSWQYPIPTCQVQTMPLFYIVQCLSPWVMQTPSLLMFKTFSPSYLHNSGSLWCLRVLTFGLHIKISFSASWLSSLGLP